MITVGLATVMRRAELLNCTWGDIDFDAQTVEVNPKQITKLNSQKDIPMFLFPQQGMTTSRMCLDPKASGVL